MDLFIQSIILCILFVLLILPPQFKNPLSQITSYPPAIRARVESLPQYQDILEKTKQKNILRKVFGAIIAIILFAHLAYYSGKTTFKSSFMHIFILFFIVNMLDLIVFDFIIFPHSKQLVIPGTEDMVNEYRNPMHHIIGAGKGIIIGTVVAALSSGLVELIKLIH